MRKQKENEKTKELMQSYNTETLSKSFKNVAAQIKQGDPKENFKKTSKTTSRLA